MRLFVVIATLCACGHPGNMQSDDTPDAGSNGDASDGGTPDAGDDGSAIGWAQDYNYSFELQEHYLQTQVPNNLVTDVVVHGGRLFVATNLGLGISTDGGVTWRTATVKNGLPGNQINSLASYGQLLAVATDRGMALSSDAGDTFTKAASIGSGISRGLRVVGTCLYGIAFVQLVRSCDQGVSFQYLNALNIYPLASVAADGTAVAMFPASRASFSLSGDN